MADDTRRTAYTTAHIDDLPVEIDDERPTTEWKPVRRFFGIGSFGTNLARATQPGDVLTYDHTEVVAAGTRHEELFLIVSGHATYRVDGKEIDAPAGTFLYVPDPAPVQPSPGAPSALGRRRRQRVRQFVVALMHAGAHLFLLDALELGGDHLLLLVAQDALGEREEHRVLLVDVQAQQVGVQRKVVGDDGPCGLALVDVRQRRVDGTDRLTPGLVLAEHHADGAARGGVALLERREQHALFFGVMATVGEVPGEVDHLSLIHI